MDRAIAQSAAIAPGPHGRVRIALRTPNSLSDHRHRRRARVRPVGSRLQVGPGTVSGAVVGLAKVAEAVSLGAPHLGILYQTLVAIAHIKLSRSVANFVLLVCVRFGGSIAGVPDAWNDVKNAS